MTAYRLASIFLAVVFAVVGSIFLFFPDAAITFFNRLSGPPGWPQSPAVGSHFYLALASGYMYLVTLLAWLMFRHPDNSTYPVLLANGKLATSALSLGFFIFREPLLIFLANFVVDGTIGVGVLILIRKKNGGRR
jgi:hypothetical protein